MTRLGRCSRFGLIAATAAGGLAALTAGAQAGGFGIHEQSATFLGSAFAGAAAGGDISSIYWNSAAAAVAPGCNASSSVTGILAKGEESVPVGLDGGALSAVSPPSVSRSTDVGTDALVPASYLSCQLTDKLFAGLALNSPFGLVTKPDDVNWVGSPLAITSKVFTVNINPTLAYKLTPTLTIGAGVQIEYFKIRLRNGGFPATLPLSGARSY
jgi:long-chain fatty acid transport protein